MNKLRGGGSILFVATTLIVLLFNSFIKNEIDVTSKDTVIDTSYKPIDISEYEYVDTIEVIKEPVHSDSLKLYLKRINIKHPDIVYAQAVLESASFSSDLYFSNANLFGMKPAKSRPYTYIGVKKGYAEYSHWKQSVLDYALFQSAFMRGLSREEYFIYLQRNYASDTKYVRKLQAIMEREDSENWN